MENDQANHFSVSCNTFYVSHEKQIIEFKQSFKNNICPNSRNQIRQQKCGKTY